jgi:hypothetical protein
MQLLTRPIKPVVQASQLDIQAIEADIHDSLKYMFQIVTIEGREYDCYREHYSQEIYDGCFDRIYKAKLFIN